MDWTLCAICQLPTGEIPKCPLNAMGPGDKSEPYRCIINNVIEFKKLNKLPVPLSFRDDITVNDFVENQAQWHNTCHNKFSTYKLQLAKKIGTGMTQRETEPQMRNDVENDYPKTRTCVSSAKKNLDNFINFRLLGQIIL